MSERIIYEPGYGFPVHLYPALDVDSGSPVVNFIDWWPAVKTEYPNLPEEVAREWLHRHWQYSPYKWLNLREYKFHVSKIRSDEIQRIRTGDSDFKEDNSAQINWGDNYCNNLTNMDCQPLYLAQYMDEHGDFPTPIIVLDNFDGHLNDEKYPRQLILVEGHTRFSVAMYLNDMGKLNEYLEIYKMKIVN